MNLHTEESIRRLVLAFYDRVRDDALLGPLFEARIGNRWNAHLERMCAFWSSVLLATGVYRGDPLGAHAGIPGIAPRHFDRWIELFEEVSEEVLEPPQAADMSARSRRMRQTLESYVERRRTGESRRTTMGGVS